MRLVDHTKTNVTFRGRCIAIYSYNKSQQYALFLNFILVNNSVCLTNTYCYEKGIKTPDDGQ